LTKFEKPAFQLMFLSRKSVWMKNCLFFVGDLHFDIPSKRARCGIKICCMCEAATGYASNFLIHSCREQNNRFGDGLNCEDWSMSENVVVEVCRHHLGQGYHVYCDTWFTSLRLARFLLQQNTLLVGTVRSGRGIPADLRQKAVQPQDCATAVDWTSRW
jgi:hypothetical protein